jgi:acylphosphatase
VSARAARSSTSNRSAEPLTSTTIRARVVVSGRVQGVWFRDATRREALLRELAGWVRNRMDGTVEAVFEGPEPAVAELVAWCRIGPPRADVTGVAVTEEPPECLKGFRIR